MSGLQSSDCGVRAHHSAFCNLSRRGSPHSEIQGLQPPTSNPQPPISAVVLGARGMLGTDLVSALRADPGFSRVEGGDLPEADITDEPAIQAFIAARKPDVIFNCAAYTDVDGCESRQELAFAVNAAAAGRVASIAASFGALLIHVSTDFIFDGRKRSPYVEDDTPAPLSVYGASKLEGERLVAERSRRWVIARTAGLYGAAGANFVDRILGMAKKAAQEKGELLGVTDQVNSPTWTVDLAAAVAALAKRFAGRPGEVHEVFHAANQGGCSRHEQIAFIVRCAALPVAVKPVESSAFPRPAKVPAYSVLNADKLRREVGRPMRPWQDALKEYLVTSALPRLLKS